ncbi:MAG: hypothetical protein KGM97_05625 [Alphaproteobacteria bacterium]|nr:hypothetical protein [Alphaproteobacteria bacterium]
MRQTAAVFISYTGHWIQRPNPQGRSSLTAMLGKDGFRLLVCHDFIDLLVDKTEFRSLLFSVVFQSIMRTLRNFVAADIVAMKQKAP